MTDTVRIVDHDPVAPFEEGLLTQLAACPWEAGRQLAANVERGAGEILVASSMAERGFYAACGFREVGEATAFWGEPVMVCALPCGPDAS